MLEKVRKTIEKNRLLTKGDRVIVGFSGGIDSLCLLHVLRRLVEYELDLWAVYINHSLRPAENIREIELLHDVGKRWGVKIREYKIDLPERLREKPQSLQLLAREERYKIFVNLRDEVKADRIALGHHQDDQVETVLYRIIRGTGLDGLAGIPIIRDDLFIRPLLEVSRNEIYEYASMHKLSWVEDSSNLKPVYIRNKIRLQLIPELKTSYNSNLDGALIRLAQLAREQHELMEALLKQKWEELTIAQGERIGIKIGPFLQLPTYLQYYLLKRVLNRAESGLQFESAVLMRLREKIVSENYSFKPAQLAKDFRACRKDGALFLERIKNRPGFKPEIFQLNAPGKTSLPELNLEVRIEKCDSKPDWNKVGNNEAYFGVTNSEAPFFIRFWRPGDVFHPLGAPGTQKLHDFFINQKVPRGERSRIPLLVTVQDQIIWVCGLRLSELFKVTEKTVDIWHITVNPLDPG